MTAVIPAGMGLPQPAQAHPVDTPSGQTIYVLSLEEQSFYQNQASLYQHQNSFTNASDLQDLDRLIFFELQIYRASAWLGSGRDYDGIDLSDSQRTACQRTLKDTSDMVSKVKNDLGLTKSQRDKAQYESVGTYITELKQRAKEFGVHRENQVGAAIALTKQLFSILGAYDRSDEAERKKIGFESDAEILDWIREVMQPEFNAIDTHFVNTVQKYWKQV